MRKRGTIKTIIIQHSLRLVRGEAERGGQGPDQQRKSPQSKQKDQGLREQVLNREQGGDRLCQAGGKSLTEKKDMYLFGSESSGFGKAEVLWRGSEEEKEK